MELSLFGPTLFSLIHFSLAVLYPDNLKLNILRICTGLAGHKWGFELTYGLHIPLHGWHRFAFTLIHFHPSFGADRRKHYYFWKVSKPKCKCCGGDTWDADEVCSKCWDPELNVLLDLEEFDD